MRLAHPPSLSSSPNPYAARPPRPCAVPGPVQRPRLDGMCDVHPAFVQVRAVQMTPTCHITTYPTTATPLLAPIANYPLHQAAIRTLPPAPPRPLASWPEISFSSLAEQLPTGAGHAGGAGRRARARSWRNARRSSFGCGIRWGSSAMGGRLIRVYVLTRTRGATPAHIIGGHVDRRNK